MYAVINKKVGGEGAMNKSRRNCHQIVHCSSVWLGLDKINYASIIFGIIGRLLGTSIIENNRALN